MSEILQNDNMVCKHCGEEIHPMHPTGWGTYSWSHVGRGSLCVVDGQFTGTSADLLRP
jgi:hypothetical protein